MRTVQDIFYDVDSQTLVYDVPEGRPSSVTSVKVFRWDESDDDEEEFAPTGAVETNPATTTDAAAGADQSDPRVVPLTATTGCEVGRVYLLTSATLETEWVEVLEVESAVSITARHPLHNTFASGSSFVSTRITAPVDDTWAADETNVDCSSGPNPMFRVRWVYVVAGKTYVADTYFNLTRYAGKHGVTPQDVEAAYPGWMNNLPTDHRFNQGRRLIDEGYRAVKLDLHGINFDDSAIAESEVVDDLVRHKVLELGEWSRMFAANDGDATRYTVARDAYAARLNSMLKLTVKVPVRDSDGAGRVHLGIGLSER